MTDKDEPTREEIISAVRQVLAEHAPDADPLDIEECIADLQGDDPDELEVNIGDAIAALCEGEAACNAAF